MRAATAGGVASRLSGLEGVFIVPSADAPTVSGALQVATLEAPTCRYASGRPMPVGREGHGGELQGFRDSKPSFLQHVIIVDRQKRLGEQGDAMAELLDRLRRLETR